MSKSVGAPIEKPAQQSGRRSLMDRFPYFYVLPADVAGINNIPADLFDAASIDGAHGWSLVTRVVVPLVSPVTRSLLLLGVIGTLQTFPIVHLMTDGGPDHAREIFGTYIFKQGFVIGDTGYSSALSTLVLLLALLLSVVQIVVLGSRVSPHANVLSPR
jgi:raffinose/stachyose/melibiose transport system permease protein